MTDDIEIVPGWKGFVAEDFKIEWETPDGFRFDAESQTGVRIAENIARLANAILQDRLENSGVVEGHEDRDFGAFVWFEDGNAHEPTHEARLVCVRKLTRYRPVVNLSNPEDL